MPLWRPVKRSPYFLIRMRQFQPIAEHGFKTDRRTNCPETDSKLFQMVFGAKVSHETNSNDRNLNDINGKRQYHTAFVLNFEHSDFDIRIWVMIHIFRKQDIFRV